MMRIYTGLMGYTPYSLRGMVRRYSGSTSHYIESMKSDSKMAETARKLIFGQKNYDQFTPAEKQIVDRYQENLLKVDGGVVLPNTAADQEIQKAQQIFRQTDHR